MRIVFLFFNKMLFFTTNVKNVSLFLKKCEKCLIFFDKMRKVFQFFRQNAESVLLFSIKCEKYFSFFYKMRKVFYFFR